MVVVSGSRFEIFFFFFALTATHVRARENEGTACVVVVSGTRFESFFCLFVCTYGHARTGTHLWACTSIFKWHITERNKT